MVDRILELTESHIIGMKNTTYNEAFFQGHFPQEHVFPGVLLVETMAQVGGILVLSNVDEPEKYSTYFLKIDKLKFKHKVIPGDTIIVRSDLTEPIRRGIVIMYCQAFVGEKIVAEGEMTAQVVKNK
jgi:UDP-3-O-[3-hydroxymyristoyl] N-acetylglucosamine deacetylase/3-hydroxyacyl-[acyl-carrier-protein] dehydratase